jgi:hypothetical protein
MSEGREQDPEVEAPESYQLEHLGRERPKCFATCYSELAFCFSVVMSQILAVSRMLFGQRISRRIEGPPTNMMLINTIIRSTTYQASMFYCLH